jgi:acyl-CoA synthetase (AMP-forming)/AMP-acid ligase II
VTLGDLLARAALRRPDADAVVDGRRRLSYAELDRRATAAARGFGRLDVRRGDRVLLVLRNRLEHVVAYWALQKLGAVAVPVNFRLAANELRYLLTDSDAKVALFVHPVEVEDVLIRHAGVRDAAVIGEPDEKWGERVVAFVVVAAGVTAEALDAHCRASRDLANFKRPRRFVLVREIPKTASGKLRRRLLRDGHYTEVLP